MILQTPLERAASMIARCDMLLSPGTTISVSSRGARLTRNTSELMTDLGELPWRAQGTTPTLRNRQADQFLHLLERGGKVLQSRQQCRAVFKKNLPPHRGGPGGDAGRISVSASGDAADIRNSQVMALTRAAAIACGR